MKILGKIIITLSLFLHILWGASAELTVNTQEVVEGNRLQITLKAVGGKASFPNIKKIAGYRILSTSSSSQYSTSIVNGQSTMQESISRIMTLQPKKAFTIPSYEIQVDGTSCKTKPIKIKVVKANIPKMNGKSQYNFEMKSKKKELVVGESFVIKLVISLAQSLQVSQLGEFIPPLSDAFLFKEIGKDKQYGVGKFVVIEKKYIVTPQKEGDFIIANSSAKIGITDKRRRDFFGRYGTKWLSISSNTLNIKVNPQPLDTNLVGDFTIESSIDTQKTKENKPVNLTITIEGKGSLEDFEFPIYEVDDVTIYSKEASITSKLVNGEIVSSYSQSFAFIASENFVIPNVKLSIYNPQTKKIEAINTESYHVEVEQKKHHTTTNPLGIVQSNNVVPKVKAKTITKAIEIEVIDKKILAGAFVLGILLTLLLQWILSFKSKKSTKFSEERALKLLYGQMSKSPEIEEMAKKLYARKKGDKSVQIDKKELKRMFKELSE